MTDRELLERAARACGLNLEWNDDGSPGYYGEWRGLPQWEHWNPLGSNGDALRLAVQLRVTLTMFTKFVRAEVPDMPDVLEDCQTDPYAATRRAIVRAAAEMGGEE